MAEPTPTPPTPEPPAPPEPPPTEPPADLGDAGKRALQAERDARGAAERKTRELEAKLEQLTTASLSDHEKALAEAKKAGAAEANATANKRIILAEVKVAAAGKLTNPELATRLLHIESFTVADDGTVDTAAITSAIDELIAKEPYLAAATAPKPAPGGKGDGGPQGTPPTPGQLTQQDLERMTRDGQHGEIRKAFSEGRFNQLQGVTP